MFVQFFLRRPVFAAVCSLLIVLAGAISIPSLPIAQYPQLAPPQVTVTAMYNGASASVVESAVTTPLEQQINGVEGMKYISSTSSNDGVSNIIVTFEIGRDPDLAAVDVQNRVQQALGRLPNEVKVTGVTVKKNSSAFVLAFALFAEHGEYDSVFISNYADRYIVDGLKRVEGMGDVQLFGERKYSMRVWLDPVRLAARKLTASDVVHALQEQNLQVAAGQIGQQPAPPGQSYTFSVRASGRLKDEGDFGRMVLKSGDDGTLVQLKDVGRAELGAEDYSTITRHNGKTAVGIGVLQLPTANALDVGDRSKKQLAQLAKSFPPGLRYEVAFDTTPFVRDSVHEVLETLAEAIVLVVLVIFLFLGSVRSTIIPAITIPVSLVGTFAFVKLLGFSINTLTLFGITLATGLVVDDAIVVIENIERFIREKGMSPKRAAGEAMGEVAGAVIATSLVLVAVFVPVAFFPGTTGRIYKQFSLTIAISVAISAFNALTLTPALCAILLERHTTPGKFFTAVERVIEAVRRKYASSVASTLRFRLVATGVFVAALAATYFVSLKVPSGFVPEEDQGYFIVAVQTPEGASVDATNEVAKRVEKILSAQPEVQNTFVLSGFSFAGNAPNKGIVFVPLKDYAERKGKEHSASAVIERVRGTLMGLTDGFVLPFAPPPIQGVGNYGGFQFEVLDRTGVDIQELAGATWGMVGQGNADTKQLKGLFSQFTANDPQLVVEVDREKAKSLRVRLEEVFSTLSVYMGSQYVNDFDFSNRSYRVYVQADARFRAEPRNIKEFYVRSDTGDMVPLASLVDVHEAVAPQIINHYNLYRSAEIVGSPAKGRSTGQAMASMEKLAKENLPGGMSFEWSGLSREELEAGSQTAIIFGLGLFVVFLVLAAQYESFALPFIVLLGVPVAILGALLGQLVRGLENDVFCQVGLLMLVGLASKNAILIVEFANQLRQRGRSIVEAARESAETRLRPILMTSLAFILGIFPLVVASGAGQAARHSLGTAVVFGMVVSTLVNLYLIPVLYVAFESLRERFKKPKVEDDEDLVAHDVASSASAAE
ncbi:RND efflux system, inner membrane transporter CmeB [Labilithrix luteola]|uniref:RND efflux system, inner membrane transporter CmeB n=1 Tax=Labilithrix luteola TaxID=1391654 RepID=A0A0K1Q1Z4_9BACT|nr:multidrug efflux RND transporter permease subunit [Labilithrix luteola]AKU99825.1 RND efflux system, inner membrane transporter CmeB [Labilithrix luteola]